MEFIAPKVTERDRQYIRETEYLREWNRRMMRSFLLPASILQDSKHHTYTEMMSQRGRRV